MKDKQKKTPRLEPISVVISRETPCIKVTGVKYKLAYIKRYTAIMDTSTWSDTETDTGSAKKQKPIAVPIYRKIARIRVMELEYELGYYKQTV